MNNIEVFDPNEAVTDSPINISKSAAKKLSQLISEEENSNLMLRVFITGGGCSGFQYGFTFEEEIKPDDFVVSEGDVRMVVDPMSYQYLVGATINFKTDMMTSQFTIDNPHAKATCGCGQSFNM